MEANNMMVTSVDVHFEGHNSWLHNNNVDKQTTPVIFNIGTFTGLIPPFTFLHQQLFRVPNEVHCCAIENLYFVFEATGLTQ